MLAQPYLDLIATHSQPGQQWVRLVGHILQGDPGRLLDRPSARGTWNAASRVYPDASPASVERAMRMCFTLLVTQLAQATQLNRAGGLDVELLLDFLSAGLDAVLRSPASRAPSSRSA
jgi:hypothetical protein